MLGRTLWVGSRISGAVVLVIRNDLIPWTFDKLDRVWEKKKLYSEEFAKKVLQEAS